MLLDEEIISQKLLKRYSIFRDPSEQPLDHLIDSQLAHTAINNSVDLLLVVVFDFDFFVSEKPQPNLTDIPHQLLLWLLMEIGLLRIVDILAVTLLVISIADGMSQSPDAFPSYYI